MTLNLILFLLAAASVGLLGSVRRLPASWLPLLILFSIVTLHSFINLFAAAPGGLANVTMEQSAFMLMLAAVALVFYRASGKTSFSLKHYSAEVIVFLAAAVLFSVSRSLPVGRQIATLVWLASFAGIAWFGFLVWAQDLDEAAKSRSEALVICRVLAAMFLVPFVITLLVNVVPPDNFAIPYPAPVAASKVSLILFIIAYAVVLRQTALFVSRSRQKARRPARELGNLA